MASFDEEYVKKCLTATLPWEHSPNGVLRFEQEPREHDLHGDNTGWCVWECSNVLLRAVSSSIGWQNILRAASECTPTQAERLAGIMKMQNNVTNSSSEELAGEDRCSAAFPAWLRTASICDFSAGVGLVGIALASAGCTAVTASDIACQLPLLRSNISASIVSEDVAADCEPSVAEYWWGTPVTSLLPHSTSPAGAPAFDVVLASDILFIALRDGVTGSLASSLRSLAHTCGAVLMAWEERLPDQEQEWLQALQDGHACRGANDPQGVDGTRGVPLQKVEGGGACTSSPPLEPVVVKEFTGDMVTLQQAEAIDGVQGSLEDGTLVGDLFWEPPPIRMVLILPAPPPETHP